MFWRKLDTLQLKLEAELRSQLAEAHRQIAELKEERQLLLGKIDRMELVLMPLSSQAGALYARSMQASRVADSAPPRAMPTDAPQTSWLTYLANYKKEQEELAKQEAAGAAKQVQ